LITVHSALLRVDGGKDVTAGGVGRRPQVVELADTISINQDFRPGVSMADPVVGDDASVGGCIAVNNQVACGIQPVDVIPDNLATGQVFTGGNWMTLSPSATPNWM